MAAHSLGGEQCEMSYAQLVQLVSQYPDASPLPPTTLDHLLELPFIPPTPASKLDVLPKLFLDSRQASHACADSPTSAKRFKSSSATATATASANVSDSFGAAGSGSESGSRSESAPTRESRYTMYKSVSGSAADVFGLISPIRANVSARGSHTFSSSTTEFQHNLVFFGGHLTELSGEAGSGKTALCLSLARQVQARAAEGGLEGRCIYVCTEPPFPSSRMREIITDAAAADRVLLLTLPLKSLPPTPGAAWNWFMSQWERLVEPTVRNPLECIRLVIVDSITALFQDFSLATDDQHAASTGSRGHTGNATSYGMDPMERASELFRWTARAKRLAEECLAAVLVTNHVVDNFRAGSSLAGAAAHSSKSSALGLAWSHCPSHRYQLERVQNVPVASRGLRKLRVVNSSVLPETSWDVQIDSDGVSIVHI
eukprot:ANDGO_00425.mRNA.1 DNA repair protein RAD51 homolog 2